MKKCLILLLIVTFFKVNSQNIKVYNGAYKRGFAKYEYFENKDYERIFEGSFYYSADNITTVKGTFKNNKKTGVWTYINNFKNSKMIIKTEGKYSNDRKIGLWTYSKIQLDAKLKSYSVSLNFQNDTLVGKINLPNLKGQFDNKGKFVGNWNYKKDNMEFIAEFRDNILIKLIDRQISDGFINSKYIPVLDSIKFDELRNKSFNQKYLVIDFSEKHDTIPNANYDFHGVKDNGNYEWKRNGLTSFIKKMDELFNDLDCQVENNFIHLNHISHINPEIIIKKTEQRESNVGGFSVKNQYGYGSGVGSVSGSGIGSGIGSGSAYSLGNRKALNKPQPDYTCQEQGRVAVQVTVDRNGNTISATSGVQGTTNTAKCLLDHARTAAQNTKWQADSNAPEKQVGKIIYTFSLN